MPVVAISCGFKSRFLHGKSQALQNFAALFAWRLRYADARLKKQLTCGGKSGNIHSCSGKPLRAETQEWRNWQTRRLQVPVVAISCGFKSRFLHFKFYQENARGLGNQYLYGFRGLFMLENLRLDRQVLARSSRRFRQYQASPNPCVFFGCFILYPLVEKKKSNFYKKIDGWIAF